MFTRVWMQSAKMCQIGFEQVCVDRTVEERGLCLQKHSIARLLSP